MSGSLMGKSQIVVDTTILSNGDSIAAYLTSAAGALITSTLNGAKQSIDTYLASNFAEDTAHVSGDIGDFVMAVRHDANTSMVSADGDYAPLQVDALGNLKVSGSFATTFTAEHDEDSPFTSGDSGVFTLLVRQDTLAISTSADGDYGAFKSNDLGELYVHDTSVLAELVLIKGDTASIVTNTGTTATNTGTISTTLTNLSKAEDAASVSGDLGIQALAVRKDAQGTNVSTDGDYSSLLTWSEGSLKVVDIANGSILQQQLSVTNVATALPTTALPNRKSLMIQNTGANKLYVGSATVTAGPTGVTNGIELAPNSFMEMEVGPAVTVYAIKTGATGNNINILEMA